MRRMCWIPLMSWCEDRAATNEAFVWAKFFLCFSYGCSGNARPCLTCNFLAARCSFNLVPL
jgi:hypothetical protein